MGNEFLIFGIGFATALRRSVMDASPKSTTNTRFSHNNGYCCMFGCMPDLLLAVHPPRRKGAATGVTGDVEAGRCCREPYTSFGGKGDVSISLHNLD